MLNATLLAALLASTSGLADTPRPGPDPAEAASMTAFTANKIYLGDGTVLEDGVILVQDGVITQFGSKLDVPAGANVIDHEGAISPGMIALHSNDGAGGELNDTTRNVMPEAEARYAFNPDHSDYTRALEAGITALVLAPSYTNLIGGQTAVVKTHGGEAVKESAQLMVGMSRNSLNFSEFPTSYGGAMAALEHHFADPEGAVSRAVGGSLPVLLDVNDQAETLRALAFAKKFRLKGALYGPSRSEHVVQAIKDSGFDVVSPPFDVGDDVRMIQSVVDLSKAGVRVGFGLDAPERHPGALRFGAALCIRAGMSAAAARKALTGDAAAIAGVGGRIGRVARGLDADLVLWSGDPVSLSSSVHAVYVGGEKAFGGAK